MRGRTAAARDLWNDTNVELMDCTMVEICGGAEATIDRAREPKHDADMSEVHIV